MLNYTLLSVKVQFKTHVVMVHAASDYDGLIVCAFFWGYRLLKYEP